MSQQQLADLSGVNRTTIGKYELKNVHPSYEILERICHALNTTPEYFFNCDKNCTPYAYEEQSKELIDLIKEADYNLHGSPISIKDKGRLYKVIKALYYDNF